MEPSWWSRAIERANKWARDNPFLVLLIGALPSVLAAITEQFVFLLVFVALFSLGLIALRYRASLPQPESGAWAAVLSVFVLLLGLALLALVVGGVVAAVTQDDGEDEVTTGPTAPGEVETGGDPGFEPPTEEETRTPILFAGNYIGDDIDEIRSVLEEAGIKVIEDPILGPKDHIGEIIKQIPDPDDHLSAPPQVHLTFIGRPEKIDLTGDLITAEQDQSPCYDQWDRGNLTLGKNTYRRGWYWSNDFHCGVRRHVVAIVAPSDEDIEEVRAIVGIPANSNEPPNRTTRVTVRIDDKVEKVATVGLIRPLVVKAQDFVRVSITFRAGPYVPVSVGRVWGIKARA